MGTDSSYTYYGDHFTVYANVKPLYSVPEINIILYNKHISVKKKISKEPLKIESNC